MWQLDCGVNFEKRCRDSVLLPRSLDPARLSCRRSIRLRKGPASPKQPKRPPDTEDVRTFRSGTLIVEDAENPIGTPTFNSGSIRVFVTVGQVVLQFVTPDSTFAASWWLAEK